MKDKSYSSCKAKKVLPSRNEVTMYKNPLMGGAQPKMQARLRHKAAAVLISSAQASCPSLIIISIDHIITDHIMLYCPCLLRDHG